MNPLSRFLYPEPDALYIFSEDNTSYWLVLFVQSDFIQSWRSVYFLGVLLEAILLISGILLHGRCVYLCWKKRILHPSLLAIMINFYVSLQAGFVARIILLPYETKAIHWNDVSTSMIPHIATVRQFGLAHGYSLLISVTCERIAATLFVSDYEKKPRFYIPAWIIFSSDVTILAVSYCFVRGIVNGYMFCIFGALPNIGCGLILRLMLRRNENRLARLSDSLHRFPNDQYSLSLRVQLKENIWSLQKIEFGVVVLIVIIVCNLCLFVGPVACFSHPDQMEALQWSMWAGNIILAFSLASSAPIGHFALALHTGARPFYVRWYLRNFAKNSVVASPEVKQTDAYFEQLHVQWDYAMTKDVRMGR